MWFLGYHDALQHVSWHLPSIFGKWARPGGAFTQHAFWLTVRFFKALFGSSCHHNTSVTECKLQQPFGTSFTSCGSQFVAVPPPPTLCLNSKVPTGPKGLRIPSVNGFYHKDQGIPRGLWQHFWVQLEFTLQCYLKMLHSSFCSCYSKQASWLLFLKPACVCCWIIVQWNCWKPAIKQAKREVKGNTAI